MSEDRGPLDQILIQNIALRSVLQQLIAQVASDSGDRTSWFRNLKARLAVVDHIKGTGATSEEGKALARDVSREVDKIMKMFGS